MSSFLIKIIAIITMLCDHTGDTIFGYLTPLNFIGRIAFPLFAFQLVIGYIHTHNIKKYAIRLLIFAFISQIPFSIANIKTDPTMLNIFFTLFLSLFVIYLYDLFKKSKYKNFYYPFCILLIILMAEFINVDYGWWGVLFNLLIYIYYPFKNKLYNNNIKSSKYSVILFIAIMFAMSIIKYLKYMYIPGYTISHILLLIAFTFIPTLFMLLYNGKKGPSMKYFFYLFYPVHLIILDIISYFIK